MNDIDKKYIFQAIREAKNFDPINLMRAKDFEDEINYMFEHPEKMYGIRTPWQKLTDLLKGWREGEVTIWTGRSGAGKSTLLNDVIVDLINQKEKVLIASFEMLPKKYLRWMLTRIKQKRILERAEVNEALSQLENLFVVNMTGNIIPSDLFDLIDFAARKYGVKHIFIDSLMKINLSGSDKYEAQKDFLNYLCDKIAKTYAAHVHLVAHPRKGFKDTDKADKMDVSGSGDITNLADNVISVYRYSKEERESNNKINYDTADVSIYLKKNREWGNEGSVDFYFNSDTKTFSEI